MTLWDSLPSRIVTAERSFLSKNADFVILRNTIVYPSLRHIAPGSVFIGFKARQLSTVSGSFNEIRYEKQLPQQRGAGPPFQNPWCFSGRSEKPYRYQVVTCLIFFDSRFRMTPANSPNSGSAQLPLRKVFINFGTVIAKK